MLFLRAPVARRSHGFWRKVLPGRGWGANWFSTFRALGAVLSGATVWYCCSRQTPASSSDLAFPRPVRISGVPFLSLVCQLTFTLRSGAFKIPTSSHFCRSRRETADQMCLLRKKKRPGHICPCHCFQGEGQFSICWPAASSSSSVRGDTMPLS